MNLDTCYRLSQHAVIRAERFGGLVYRHDNRRLYFLHSRALVDFVSGLGGSCRLAEALDDFLAARALPESARQTLLHSLTQLEKLGVLDEL
jgi:mycofactocin biosynthesis protein MftB